MTTGIRDRDSLYVKLREVLGDEQAATLMELLPPDREQLATKADILDVKTELKADLTDLRTALKADVTNLKTELKADGAELRSEFAELRSEFAELRTDVSLLNERMDRMESLMVKFDERLWEFHGALRSQTRTYVTATVSSMMGVGGLAFAAAAFM
jgi:predicted nuclease with TOPRIM domain